MKRDFQKVIIFFIVIRFAYIVEIKQKYKKIAKEEVKEKDWLSKFLASFRCCLVRNPDKKMEELELTNDYDELELSDYEEKKEKVKTQDI